MDLLVPVGGGDELHDLIAHRHFRNGLSVQNLPEEQLRFDLLPVLPLPNGHDQPCLHFLCLHEEAPSRCQHWLLCVLFGVHHDSCRALGVALRRQLQVRAELRLLHHTLLLSLEFACQGADRFRGCHRHQGSPRSQVEREVLLLQDRRVHGCELCARDLRQAKLLHALGRNLPMAGR